MAIRRTQNITRPKKLHGRTEQPSNKSPEHLKKKQKNKKKLQQSQTTMDYLEKSCITLLRALHVMWNLYYKTLKGNLFGPGVKTHSKH